jgi:hypothetical protein
MGLVVENLAFALDNLVVVGNLEEDNLAVVGDTCDVFF